MGCDEMDDERTIATVATTIRVKESIWRGLRMLSELGKYGRRGCASDVVTALVERELKRQESEPRG